MCQRSFYQKYRLVIISMGCSGILAVIWWVLKVLLMNDDSSFDATMGRDELTIAVRVACNAGSYLHLVLLCVGDDCSDPVHDVLGVEKGDEKRIEESPAFMYYEQRTKLGCLSTLPGPQLLPSQAAVEQHHPIHVIANSGGGCIPRGP